MATSTTISDLISKEAAARKCGVSVRTLQRWMLGGLIPSVRVGPAIRFYKNIAPPAEARSNRTRKSEAQRGPGNGKRTPATCR